MVDAVVRVCNTSGQPVPGAEVQAFASAFGQITLPWPEQTLITGPEGLVQFVGLFHPIVTPAEHTFKVSGSGIESGRATICWGIGELGAKETTVTVFR